MHKQLVIILLAIVAVFVSDCAGNNSSIGREDSRAKTTGQAILITFLDPDNGYYSTEPRSVFNPDNYELYYKGKLDDTFYSQDFWINLGRSCPPDQQFYEWSTNYFAFLLPRQDKESFYLLTDWGWIYAPKYRFELRRYRTTDLLDVRKAVQNGEEINGYAHDVVAIYDVQFEPEFSVSSARPPN